MLKTKGNFNISLDILLSIIFSLGILQAISANLARFNLFFLQLILVVLLIITLPKLFSIRKYSIHYLLLCIWQLAYMLILFLCLRSDFPEEFVYQLSASFSFATFCIFASVSEITVKDSCRLVYLRTLLILYLIASLFIHIFLWEQVASLFYKRSSDLGGLLMDGSIHRMYGLLFNPLASSFTAFLLILMLFTLSIKDRILYIILSIILILSLSRSTILMFGFFLLYILFYMNKIRGFVVGLLLISATLIFFYVNGLPQFPVDAFSDSTGSIVEHILNYQIGFQHVLSLFGEGFSDARNFGGWNTRLESMPLQYALTGGALSFFPLMFQLIMATVFIVIRYGVYKGLATLFFFPLLFSFPMHTFNLPMTYFALFCSTWAFRKISYINRGKMVSQ